MKLLSLASLLVLVVPNLASADGFRGDTVDRVEHTAAAAAAPRRWRVMALETLGLYAIGQAWYWRHGATTNASDWNLPWELRSIGPKLTGAGWRFDDNDFITNAVKHPVLFGTSVHLLARENGFGLAGSFLVSTAVSAGWEMFGELAEYASINDMLSTSTAGTPLGEAVYQMVHHRRQTEVEVRAGATRQGAATYGRFGVRGELDRIPGGGGQVADNQGGFIDGKLAGLALEVSLDDDGVRAWELEASTSLIGRYRNHVARDDDGDAAGYNLFVGAGAAFDYRHVHDRPELAWDALANTKVGPTVRLDLHHAGVTVRTGVALSGDFAMVKSMAFERWRAMHPDEIVRSSLEDDDHVYYYALGASLEPRLVVEYRGLTLGGMLRGSRFSSLDGRDRRQELITSDVRPEDVEHRARAWLGYQLHGVALTVEAEHHLRRGWIGDTIAEQVQRRTTVTLGYRF